MDDRTTTRAGQDAFNALARWRPDLAAAIVGGDDDPFFDDARLERFHLAVARMLTPAPDLPAPGGEPPSC